MFVAWRCVAAFVSVVLVKASDNAEFGRFVVFVAVLVPTVQTTLPEFTAIPKG
jgi:Flp pilus assembly pilin Flp